MGKGDNQLMGMSEFQDFLEAVPDSERLVVANMLREHNMSTFDGFIGFSKDVMISILVGQIPPGVAAAAERWAELCFTAICVANDKYNVSPQQTQFNILQVLNEARQALPPIEASGGYSLVEESRQLVTPFDE